MLTLWKPQNDLFSWPKEFDDFWGSNGSHRLAAKAFDPAVDVEESENAILLHADLPGIAEKDIELTIDDSVLTISGKRESASEKKTGTRFISERRYGSFERRFRLDSNIDTDNVTANYKNGVLSVTLPRKESAKPKQIPVKH